MHVSLVFLLKEIITHFILTNKMLDLDTYVDPETHEIINSRYLRGFSRTT
jgi:hypothetical protein